MTNKFAMNILEQRECCRECVVENCTCAECDEAFDMAIKALEQEPTDDATLKDIFCMGCEYKEQQPCDDAISRQAVLEKAISVPIAKVVTEDEVIYRKVVFVDDIENLPPVTPQKMGHCKDCKYFEYDSVAKVDGIPLIVAHEICSRWGDGCKTSEDGYCFLFEPQERSEE